MTAVRSARSDLEGDLGGWSAGARDRATTADVVLRLASVAAAMAIRVAEESLSAVAGTVDAGTDRGSLDADAERAYLSALAGADVAAVSCEGAAEARRLRPSGATVVTLDPIDGASNIDIDASVGSFFSVLPSRPGETVEQSLLQPGRAQTAAGMVLFGPGTVLALTWGEGTHVYALDPHAGTFRRAVSNVSIPAEAQEYAIDASNARHWDQGIRSYVADLVSGAGGPRERDFSMRWLACLAAEAYRILLRGGIYLYPADDRPGLGSGRIRLVQEANPVAFLCEQAGGGATDGRASILDLVPGGPDQRTPLVFGSRAKVARVRRYLETAGDSDEEWPLFSERGLFRV